MFKTKKARAAEIEAERQRKKQDEAKKYREAREAEIEAQKPRDWNAEVKALEKKLADFKQEAREAMNRQAWAETREKERRQNPDSLLPCQKD